MIMFATAALLAASAGPDPTLVERTLRKNDQALLDAIAPGDRATWERLLTEVHVDDERENYHGIALQANYLMTETWLKQGADWRLAMVHAYVVATDPPAIVEPQGALNEYQGRYRAGADLATDVDPVGGGAGCVFRSGETAQSDDFQARRTSSNRRFRRSARRRGPRVRPYAALSVR